MDRQTKAAGARDAQDSGAKTETGEGTRRRLSVFAEPVDVSNGGQLRAHEPMSAEDVEKSRALRFNHGRRESLPGQLPPGRDGGGGGGGGGGGTVVPPIGGSAGVRGGLQMQRKVLHKAILDKAASELSRARRPLPPDQKHERALLVAKVEARTKHFVGATWGRSQRREDLNERLLAEERGAVAAQVDDVAAQAESIVGERLRGDLVFLDRPAEERANAFLEQELHQADQSLFASSAQLTNDFRDSHVGAVRRVVLTEEEKQRQAEQLRQMRLFSEAEDARRAVADAKKGAAARLVAARERQAAVRTETEELSTKGKHLAFEVRAAKRRQLIVDKAQSDAAMVAAVEAVEAAALLKGDAAAQGADAEQEEWLAKLTGADENDAAAALGPGEGIKSWFIGRPDDGTPGIGTLLYGCYSTADEPPERGWHPVQGKAPAPTLSATSARVKVWIGASAGSGTANGSYTRNSKRDGVEQFVKVDGMTLFRATIKESPELGLTVAACNPPLPTLEELDNEARAREARQRGHGGGSNQDPPSPPAAEEAPKDPETIVRLMKDPFDFGSLQKAGHLLGMDTIGAQREHRRRQAEDAEKRMEAMFEQARAQASEMLHEHDSGDGEGGEGGEGGGEGRKSKPKGRKKKGMSLQAEMHAAEAEKVGMLQAPNITYQATAADAALILGGEPRVFYGVEASHVPPLCHAWVMLACAKSGIACKKRHYYVDDEEKAASEERRASTDMKLEMACLRAIARRETLLAEVAAASRAALKAYQAHTEAVKAADVAPLLALMEQLRLASVQVVEAVVGWRAYVEKMGAMVTEHASGAKEPVGGWSVAITVQGAELYGASTAFTTRQARFCRDYEPPKREKKRIFLGCFKSKNDAARAYDDACALQAVRLNTTVDRMAGKVFVFRTCGRHFGVESADAGPSSCEQCAVDRLGGNASWTPAYMWNGRNYLLKMMTDCAELADCEPLIEFLPADFPLEGNPFLLPRSLDDLAELQERRVAAAMAASAAAAANADGAKELSEADLLGPAAASARGASTAPLSSMRGMVMAASLPSLAALGMGGAPGDDGDAAGFGMPTTTVLTHVHGAAQKDPHAPPPTAAQAMAAAKAAARPSADDGSKSLTEWAGHMAVGTAVTVGRDRIAEPNERLVGALGMDETTRGSVELLEETRGGSRVELLDMVRVNGAVKTLLQERELNAWLAAPPDASSGKAKTRGFDDDGGASSSEEEVDAAAAAAKKKKRPPVGRPDEGSMMGGEYEGILGQEAGDRVKVALYTQSATSLAMPQSRGPDRFRKAGVWCRPDKGEWATMAVRGEHMKHFQYEVYLKRRGLYTQAQQKYLLQEIKREQRKGLGGTDVHKILLLLEEARRLHMDALLTLEVAKAEKFAERFLGKAGAALSIQRTYRGLLGRRRLEARQDTLAAAEARRTAWEGEVAKVCFGFVSKALTASVKKAAKAVLKPVTGHLTTVLDGQAVVASVTSLRTTDYYRRGQRPKVPCLSCLRLRPKMRYSVARKEGALTTAERKAAVALMVTSVKKRFGAEEEGGLPAGPLKDFLDVLTGSTHLLAGLLGGGKLASAVGAAMGAKASDEHKLVAEVRRAARREYRKNAAHALAKRLGAAVRDRYRVALPGAALAEWLVPTVCEAQEAAGDAWAALVAKERYSDAEGRLRSHAVDLAALEDEVMGEEEEAEAAARVAAMRAQAEEDGSDLKAEAAAAAAAVRAASRPGTREQSAAAAAAAAAVASDELAAEHGSAADEESAPLDASGGADAVLARRRAARKAGSSSSSSSSGGGGGGGGGGGLPPAAAISVDTSDGAAYPAALGVMAAWSEDKDMAAAAARSAAAAQGAPPGADFPRAAKQFVPPGMVTRFAAPKALPKSPSKSASKRGGGTPGRAGTPGSSRRAGSPKRAHSPHRAHRAGHGRPGTGGSSAGGSLLGAGQPAAAAAAQHLDAPAYLAHLLSEAEATHHRLRLAVGAEGLGSGAWSWLAGSSTEKVGLAWAEEAYDPGVMGVAEARRQAQHLHGGDAAVQTGLSRMVLVFGDCAALLQATRRCRRFASFEAAQLVNGFGRPGVLGRRRVVVVLRDLASPTGHLCELHLEHRALRKGGEHGAAAVSERCRAELARALRALDPPTAAHPRGAVTVPVLGSFALELAARPSVADAAAAAGVLADAEEGAAGGGGGHGRQRGKSRGGHAASRAGSPSRGMSSRGGHGAASSSSSLQSLQPPNSELVLLHLEQMVRERENGRWEWKWQVDPGPCWCRQREARERLLLRAYDPARGVTYTHVLENGEALRRVTEQHDHMDAPPADSLLGAACAHGVLPTDHVLGLTDAQGYDGYNEPTTVHPGLAPRKPDGSLQTLAGPGRKAIPRPRESFEPVREADRATKVAREAARHAAWLSEEAKKAHADAEAASRLASARSVENQEATRRYHEADEAMVKAQLKEREFAQQARNALAFSNAQLAQFEDMSLASEQQSWEPLEDGNNWRMIRMKRATQLAAAAAVTEREEAHFANFQASMDAAWAAEEAKISLRRAAKIDTLAGEARKKSNTYGAMAGAAAAVMDEALLRILNKLTLRHTGGKTAHGGAGYGGAPGTVGGRVSHTLGRRLVFYEPAWCPPRFGSALVPPPPAAPRFPLCPPPHVLVRMGAPQLSGYNVVSVVAKRVFAPQLQYQTGPRKSALIRITVLADPQYPEHMLCRGYRAEDSIVEEIHCEDVDIYPLLTRPPYRAPATAARHDLYRPLALEGTARRQQETRDGRRKAIANELIGLAKLDPFTGRLAIGRMNLFQKLRMLTARMLSGTQWWEDLLAGKSRWKGVEVFREVRAMGGRLCLVQVFENWGDLTFEAYDRASADHFSLRVPFDAVCAALAETDEADGELPGSMKQLDFWLNSVRWGRFNEQLMRLVCDQLDMVPQPRPLRPRLKFRPAPLPTPPHKNVGVIAACNEAGTGGGLRLLKRIGGRYLVVELRHGGRGEVRVVAFAPRKPPDTRVCPETLDVLVTWTTEHGGSNEQYELLVPRAAQRLALVGAGMKALLHPDRAEARLRALASMLALRTTTRPNPPVGSKAPRRHQTTHASGGGHRPMGGAAVAADAGGGAGGHGDADFARPGRSTTGAAHDYARAAELAAGVRGGRRASVTELSSAPLITTHSLRRQVAEINAWIELCNADAHRWRNPLATLSTEVVEGWVAAVQKRRTPPADADRQLGIERELVLSTELPEDAHWDDALFKGAAPFGVPGGCRGLLGMDSQALLIVEIHRPPTDGGAAGDLVVRVRPEGALERDSRGELAGRVSMGMEEARCRHAWELADELREAARKQAGEAAAAARERRRIETSRRRARAEASAEEKLRQVREALRVAKAGELSAEKQALAVRLLAQLDLKLAEVRDGHFQEFLSLPKDVRLMGQKEWAEEEKEEEALKEAARLEALGLAPPATADGGSAFGSRPATALRPRTGVLASRAGGGSSSRGGSRPGTGARPGTGLLLLRPGTGAAGGSSAGSRPATAEPAPGGYTSRPTTAQELALPPRPGTAASVLELLEGRVAPDEGGGGGGAAMERPTVVAGGAEIFTLDDGDAAANPNEAALGSMDEMAEEAAPAEKKDKTPKKGRFGGLGKGISFRKGKQEEEKRLAALAAEEEEEERARALAEKMKRRRPPPLVVRRRFGKAVDLQSLCVGDAKRTGAGKGYEPPGPLLLAQTVRVLGGAHVLVSVCSTYHSRTGLRFEAYDPASGDSRIIFADVSKQLGPEEEEELDDPVALMIKAGQRDFVAGAAAALGLYKAGEEVQGAVLEKGTRKLTLALTRGSAGTSAVYRWPGGTASGALLLGAKLLKALDIYASQSDDEEEEEEEEDEGGDGGGKEEEGKAGDGAAGERKTSIVAMARKMSTTASAASSFKGALGKKGKGKGKGKGKKGTAGGGKPPPAAAAKKGSGGRARVAAATRPPAGSKRGNAAPAADELTLRTAPPPVLEFIGSLARGLSQFLPPQRVGHAALQVQERGLWLLRLTSVANLTASSAVDAVHKKMVHISQSAAAERRRARLKAEAQAKLDALRPVCVLVPADLSRPVRIVDRAGALADAARAALVEREAMPLDVARAVAAQLGVADPREGTEAGMPTVAADDRSGRRGSALPGTVSGTMLLHASEAWVRRNGEQAGPAGGPADDGGFGGAALHSCDLGGAVPLEDGSHVLGAPAVPTRLFFGRAWYEDAEGEQEHYYLARPEDCLPTPVLGTLPFEAASLVEERVRYGEGGEELLPPREGEEERGGGGRGFLRLGGPPGKYAKGANARASLLAGRLVHGDALWRRLGPVPDSALRALLEDGDAAMREQEAAKEAAVAAAQEAARAAAATAWRAAAAALSAARRADSSRLWAEDNTALAPYTPAFVLPGRTLREDHVKGEIDTVRHRYLVRRVEDPYAAPAKAGAVCVVGAGGAEQQHGEDEEEEAAAADDSEAAVQVAAEAAATAAAATAAAEKLGGVTKAGSAKAGSGDISQFGAALATGGKAGLWGGGFGEAATAAVALANVDQIEHGQPQDGGGGGGGGGGADGSSGGDGEQQRGRRPSRTSLIAGTKDGQLTLKGGVSAGRARRMSDKAQKGNLMARMAARTRAAAAAAAVQETVHERSVASMGSFAQRRRASLARPRPYKAHARERMAHVMAVVPKWRRFVTEELARQRGDRFARPAPSPWSTVVREAEVARLAGVQSAAAQQLRDPEWAVRHPAMAAGNEGAMGGVMGAMCPLGRFVLGRLRLVADGTPPPALLARAAAISAAAGGGEHGAEKAAALVRRAKRHGDLRAHVPLSERLREQSLSRYEREMERNCGGRELVLEQVLLRTRRRLGGRYVRVTATLLPAAELLFEVETQGSLLPLKARLAPEEVEALVRASPELTLAQRVGWAYGYVQTADKAAQLLAARLTVTRRNGAVTLAFRGMPMGWARETIEREEGHRAAHRGAAARRVARGRAVAAAVRDETRLWRLEAVRRRLAAERRAARLLEMLASVREWPGMALAEAESRSVRPYLVCDERTLRDVRDAFNVFAARGPKDPATGRRPRLEGEIETAEFQQLCFEMGELFTRAKVDRYVAELGLNADMRIDVHDFVLWWLCSEHRADAARTFSLKLLSSRLAAKRRARLVNRAVRRAIRKRAVAVHTKAVRTQRRVAHAAGKTKRAITGAVAKRRDAVARVVLARKRKVVGGVVQVFGPPVRAVARAAGAPMRLQQERKRKRVAAMNDAKQRQLDDDLRDKLAEAERKRQARQNAMALLGEEEAAAQGGGAEGELGAGDAGDAGGAGGAAAAEGGAVSAAAVEAEAAPAPAPNDAVAKEAVADAAEEAPTANFST